MATIAGRHHFGEGWAVDAILPVGMAALTDVGGRDGVAGFGDIELGARYELGALWGVGGYSPSVTLRLGVGLPTGARATTSSATGMPNALRVGTGTFGVAGDARYTQFLDRLVALSLTASVRQALSTDSEGRRPGVRFGATLEGVFFPIEWLLLRVGVGYQFVGQLETATLGVAVNSGGHWLRLDGLALFRVSDALSLGAGARVPLYVNVNGTQLAEEWGVQAVVAVPFGGADDEDEHDHDHGDEHDHEGDAHDHGGQGDAHDHGGASGAEPREPGDVLDVAVDGASFDLEEALAAGRVTVVDFWAEWCHPCGHIDELLREMASQHPDLAVRRVEVPAVSAAVAREHLGDQTTLPQVWIFDRGGRRVDRLVGTNVADVRERTEAALRAPRSSEPDPPIPAPPPEPETPPTSEPAP